MSKRRQIGDRVWVTKYAAFGASKGQWATIIDWKSNQKDELEPCSLSCGDDECIEWNDLVAENGTPFYHVSECEMLDIPGTEIPGIVGAR